EVEDARVIALEEDPQGRAVARPDAVQKIVVARARAHRRPAVHLHPRVGRREWHPSFGTVPGARRNTPLGRPQGTPGGFTGNGGCSTTGGEGASAPAEGTVLPHTLPASTHAPGPGNRPASGSGIRAVSGPLATEVGSKRPRKGSASAAQAPALQRSWVLISRVVRSRAGASAQGPGAATAHCRAEAPGASALANRASAAARAARPTLRLPLITAPPLLHSPSAADTYTPTIWRSYSKTWAFE